ncbi:MAG TPA: prolipoprotein diacylglyceryl transferase [Syntrophorhabdaceae bacterium]|nr:prolipoprotein diacylglyceryl transferase [Syntrophorhabdaceae bacterium]HOL04588.1 prolipoprotein diacylglyceryl transferase [Syntrophorhabdaceae bacterium]HPP41356.1 prolipoprotein diacylglyceryl transferase [Syntrophorhabdaceae bacterium]
MPYTDEIFVISISLACIIIQRWGFKNLPKDRWQILASIPIKKNSENNWSGVNITFYGFFIATAYTLGLIFSILLLNSISISTRTIFIIFLIIGLICIPASKIVAKLIEKKQHTYTVGGASFIGIIITPWILEAISFFNNHYIQIEKGMIFPMLTAFAIVYAFGEGIGRLACLSFGCCYGKPVNQSPVFIQRLVRRYAIKFMGDTKKAVYAGGYKGERLIPIQSITSFLYVRSSILGMYLFLKGYYYMAFLEVIIVTQIWRIFSEFLRADYRGEGKLTKYQIMGIISILYSIVILFFIPSPPVLHTDIKAGLWALWNPAAIIILIAVWYSILFIYGKSRVIASSINYRIIKENV